ncbi:Scytalone dehydratase, partial [Dionaea muscipula]
MFPVFQTLFCWQIIQFLDSQGFLDYIERGIDSKENNSNLLDKLQDAIGRGQNPESILPSSLLEAEIITIAESSVKYQIAVPDTPTIGSLQTLEQKNRRKEGSRFFCHVGEVEDLSGKLTYDPGESLSPRERVAEWERMVLDIKVKLQVIEDGIFWFNSVDNVSDYIERHLLPLPIWEDLSRVKWKATAFFSFLPHKWDIKH